jgi:hypothetical protein
VLTSLATLRIVDPAMGSGAFLAGALRCVRDALRAAAARLAVPDAANAVGTALAVAANQCAHLVSSHRLLSPLLSSPRLSAFSLFFLEPPLLLSLYGRCIYGVDLNAASVGLTADALALLLPPHTNLAGLRSHLRRGDSLWGVCGVGDLLAVVHDRNGRYV